MNRAMRLLTLCALAGLTVPVLSAPHAPAPHAGQREATSVAPPTAQRGRRDPVGTMILSTSAWPDGGAIPAKYTQAGDEVSPPLSWSDVPEGVVSFALLMHDVDAAVGDGTTDVLHWLLWNLPPTSSGVAENLPDGAELPGGARQISQSGPYYRGPGALAAGPAHHYVLEVFALDVKIDVPAVGASPAETRAAVMAAMAGHIRAKGAYVGLFKRPPS